MSRTEFSKARQDFITEKQKQFFQKIRTAQRNLYSLILENFIGISTDLDGNIKFTAGNIRKGDNVSVLVSAFNESKNLSLGKWLARKFLDLFNLNKSYFKTIEPKKVESRADKARKLVLRRLGFDVDKEQLIKNGYIENLVNSNQIGLQVAQRINQAIAAGLPLKQFRNQLRDDFTAPNKLGLLEQHYHTNSFDIFQQNDRAIGKVMADELGLQYVIWNHVPKDTSTAFCKERSGKVFSVKELEEWDRNLTWKGKKQVGHKTILDGHGYNCRTSIDYISKELAFRLRPELKEND